MTGYMLHAMGDCAPGLHCGCLGPTAALDVVRAERDRLAAENADLRAKLSHYADGRPTLYREPGGPTP